MHFVIVQVKMCFLSFNLEFYNILMDKVAFLSINTKYDPKNRQTDGQLDNAIRIFTPILFAVD